LINNRNNVKFITICFAKSPLKLYCRIKLFMHGRKIRWLIRKITMMRSLMARREDIKYRFLTESGHEQFYQNKRKKIYVLSLFINVGGRFHFWTGRKWEITKIKKHKDKKGRRYSKKKKIRAKRIEETFREIASSIRALIDY